MNQAEELEVYKEFVKSLKKDREIQEFIKDQKYIGKTFYMKSYNGKEVIVKKAKYDNYFNSIRLDFEKDNRHTYVKYLDGVNNIDDTFYTTKAKAITAYIEAEKASASRYAKWSTNAKLNIKKAKEELEALND